jgi:hypothetical protein
LRDLPDEGEGREKPQGFVEQDMEMAHYLVPGMEGLSEGAVPAEPLICNSRLSRTVDRQK